MPLTNDGNERDVRLRPDVAPIAGADADLTQPLPVGQPCSTVGVQTDLPPTGISVSTPSGDYNINYDWANLAALCPRGLDMRSVERVLFQILAQHFSDPANIFNPALKGLIYNDNPLQAKLQIYLNTDFHLPSATKTPGLILKRGEQKFGRISINDRGERTFPTTSGEMSFVRRVDGSHMILCASAAPGETENLANELVDLFTCVSPIMRSQLLFADFEQVGVSEISITDDIGNATVTAVQLSYKYELGWTMRYATPLVGAIGVRTLINVEQA